MKKNNLKLNILVILSLCLAGLIVFSGVYFLHLNQKKLSADIHLSKPIELEFFETAFKFNKKELDLSNKSVVAGIIPHHLLAADLIAEFFYNLQGRDYETVILVGPNHFNSGDFDIIASSDDWQTPYGILECDRDALKKLMQSDGIKIQEEAIEGEHSINSEVSFIKKVFPAAKLVPIILKSTVIRFQAQDLADKLFELSKNKKILVLASVDFSHYKDSLAAQKNDQDSIQAINNFDFNKIYLLDIDSPASVYSLLKFSQLSGANFELLHNSNSAILANKPDLESTTSYVTGYFTKQDKISNSYLPENKTTESPVRMLFFGDMMLDRTVADKIKQDGLDYVFGQLDKAGFYDNYDLISTNLEGAVTDEGNHYLPFKEFDFAFSPEVLTGIKEYNFNFLNLANNHLTDQGEQGIVETRHNLDELGFYYSGCRDGRVGECSVKVVEIKNKKVALVGLSMVYSRFDLGQAENLIMNLADMVDLVIVNIHWGEEYNVKFSSHQQETGRGLIDAGADLIIGHHPHVVQGVEVYKDKPIFYSLGNFVFDQYFSEETQRGLAVELIFKEDQLNFKLDPFKSQKSQVRLMDEPDKNYFLEEVAKRSVLSDEFNQSILKGELKLVH